MCIKVIEEIFLRKCGHYTGLGREVASQLMEEEKEEKEGNKSGCEGGKEKDNMAKKYIY